MKRVIVLLALLAIATPALAQGGMPDAQTERAELINDVYGQIYIAAIVVFVIVFALFAFILVRFRESSGAGRATYEKERDNLKAEAAWTIIPLIIVMWVGVISYQALVELDQDANEAEAYMTLPITGYQWVWEADYGEFKVTASDPVGNIENMDPIVVPADVLVRYEITGGDVIHSFNILALGQTLDAVPGHLNILTAALPPGEYFTQCKEHCLNPGHSYMRAKVIAMPIPEYNEWFEATQAGAAAGLTHTITIDATGGIATDDFTKVAKGAAINFVITTGADETMFTVGQEAISIPAGTTETFAVSGQELGSFTLTDGSNILEFEAVEPAKKSIELGAYLLNPDMLDLTVGEVTIVEVENTHTTLHNVFIGSYDSQGNSDVLWNSKTIGSGDKDAFLVIAKDDGTIDMWCDVSGHYSAGMKGDVTVS
jgi:cytochrome c oxidase subunit 2